MNAKPRSIRSILPILALLAGAGALAASAGAGTPPAQASAAAHGAAAGDGGFGGAGQAGLAGQAGEAAEPWQVGAQGIRLVTAPTGNEARYRVREQLARIEFPSDAVGTTTNVRGTLVIDAQGRVVRGDSRFTVDLASITTDSDRRDNYVRRNTLKTEEFPEAVFAPTAFEGLPNPLPTAGELSFQLIGDLTLHGTTRPVTWDVTARAAGGGAYTGTARTQFGFSYFGIPVPRVASVLSVTETVRLEYDFRLVTQ